MLLIDALAERHIAASRDRGELDNLPGAGKPLVLDDDSHVHESLRAGYRLLKNAGFVPPEVLVRREIHDVQQLVRLATDTVVEGRQRRRLQRLRLKLAVMR